MKTLLTLLFLIPSLSLGLDYSRKDIPVTKTELSYLYGFNLGDIFDKNQLTENGLKDFNEKLLEDTEKPYIYLSRQTGNKSNDSSVYSLKFNILNDDFDTIALYVNRETLSIGRIYLYKEIVAGDIRNQLSGLLGILDLKEIDGVNLSTCEEFKSTVIDVYRIKRGIKENLKEYYEYFVSNEDGINNEINGLLSNNLLKDKNNNLLQAYCSYQSYNSQEERKLYTRFILSLKSEEYQELEEFNNSSYDAIEIEKDEFNKLLSLFFELNMDGL